MIYPNPDVGYPTITSKVETWNNYCSIRKNLTIPNLLNIINIIYASPSSYSEKQINIITTCTCKVYILIDTLSAMIQYRSVTTSHMCGTTQSHEWYHELNWVGLRVQPSGDFKTHKWEMPRTHVRVTESNRGTMYHACGELKPQLCVVNHICDPVWQRGTDSPSNFDHIFQVWKFITFSVNMIWTKSNHHLVVRFVLCALHCSYCMKT